MAVVAKKRKSLQQMANEANGGDVGILCPKCGQRAHRVFRTKQGDNVVRRERICLNCRHKQTTYERPL